MKVLTRFQEALSKAYNQTRKRLRTRLKRSMAPADVKAFIRESFTELTERQAPIIARYIYNAYKSGTGDAKKELKSVKIEAAAPIPDMGNVGMDLSEVSQQQMNRIFHTHLGAIGDYNENLSKTLQTQYNKLLSDNKLIASLNRDGWTPWLDETLKKQGMDPAVIDLIKGQKTSKQMVNILELHGIKGGKHPNEVAKMLVPHVNRFFGPEGVSINNIGKTVKRFRIDADGNYGWFDQKITRKYKATPRTYSRLIARDTLRQARMDAYYESLSKSKLVDHYISVAHMDSNTCAHCAMMHGQTVTKGAGPQYHSNCGCDLRPVWKSDSPLASQNKPDAFYEKQRDMHFLRMNDLKRYNAEMPRGSHKLKYATQLPEDAITKVMPDKEAMRAIRHEMLGRPAAIKQSGIPNGLEVRKVENAIFTTNRDKIRMDLQHYDVSRASYDSSKIKYTAAEADALDTYKGFGFVHINNSLRGNPIAKQWLLADNVKPIIKNMDSAIVKGKLPNDIITYRGISENVAKRLLNENICKDLGFSSTSFDPKMALDLTKRGKDGFINVLQFKAKKGTNAAMWPGFEDELLFKRGLELKCTEIREVSKLSEKVAKQAKKEINNNVRIFIMEVQ